MGLGGERHDLHSYETHAGTWIGFRQPVTRVAAERAGRVVTDTRDTNPGEVWEENELWIELSWRIDPDGSLGIRRWFEAPDRPGEKLTVDDYYGWIFEHSVPGLPEAAAAEGLTPLAYMRKYGAFEIEQDVYGRHDEPVDADRPRRRGGATGRSTGRHRPRRRTSSRRRRRRRMRTAVSATASSSTARDGRASPRLRAGSSSTPRPSPSGAGRTWRCPRTRRRRSPASG